MGDNLAVLEIIGEFAGCWRGRPDWREACPAALCNGGCGYIGADEGASRGWVVGP